MSDAAPSFSVVAYLAAVAVGCVAIGMSLPFLDPTIGRGVHLEALLAMAGSAMLVGFLPGLLLCLPMTLLCLWLARRLGLVSGTWASIMGAFVGLTTLGTLALAFKSDLLIGYGALICAIAGALAGITYFELAALEQRRRR